LSKSCAALAPSPDLPGPARRTGRNPTAIVITEPISLAGPWKVEVGVRREGVPDDVRIPFTFDASLPAQAGVAPDT
jgi:hypothetical protein